MNKQYGFSLIELIMVIVIMGVIASVVGIFIRTPVDQYLGVARRAEMTDIADTALRRMGRDIRTAVPNSVRLSGAYLEFLPTKAGGRYRGNAIGGTGSCAAAGDDLNFAIADTCFEITSPAIIFAAGDKIVVGSTQANGNPPYDTSSSGVLRTYTGAVGTQPTVFMTGAAQFPTFASLPNQRFQVISGATQAVTYACTNVGGTVDGTGTLVRYWGYGFNTAQVAPPISGSSALLASKISACSITYNAINQRDGLIAISLTILEGGDSISLYQEIHVNNIDRKSVV
jgi:MSHA biogenesis protein MshO